MALVAGLVGAQVAAQAGKALTTEQAETLTRLAQALAASW